MMQTWTSLDGAVIPLSCAIDVLGNVYNTNTPTSHASVMRYMSSLTHSSETGMSVALDPLLLELLDDCAAGRCPVEPMECPRRITDGSLGNAKNMLGVESSPRSPRKSSMR